MKGFRSSSSFEPVMSHESHSMEDWSSTLQPRNTSYPRGMPEKQDFQRPLLKEPHPRRRGFKKFICFYISLIVGLGWLAPILYLLIVNIRGDEIGAAAWCPIWDSGCHAISYSENSNVTSAQLSQSFDEANHDLLGALQFVAKALEVWFMYIATTLVWYVTSILAKRPGGLPIGYLLTHLEFGDIRALFDPTLYVSPGHNGRGPTGSRRHTYHLYLFAFTAILMCILTNLMGPSVAVLVLPTLHWQNNPQTPTGQFQELLSADAPSGDNAIPGCSASDLANGFWNCTNYNYGNTLDALVRTVAAEIDQNIATPDNPNYESTYFTTNTAVTLEASIPFSFNLSLPQDGNSTNHPWTFWSYSRQLMRGLSADFEDLYTVVLGNTTNQTKIDHYQPYNTSLLLNLQRSGPVFGLNFYNSWGNITVTTVADNKAIRCISEFTSTYKTKCFRTGTGWNSTNNFDSFTIDKTEQVDKKVFVAAYWSDKATYIDDGDPCFPNGTLPEGSNCDYDTIFNNVAPIDTLDRNYDMFVLEYNLPTSEFPHNTYVSEVFPSYGFATYGIDVTSVEPSLQPAQVPDPPDPSAMYPMVLHPDWLLAAYGVVSGGDPGPYGDTAFILQNAMNSLFGSTANPDFFDDFLDSNRLYWVTYYSVLETVSMIPYTTTPTNSLTSTASNQGAQPVLWSAVYNEIWGFGIDSRTSKLGLVVTTMGCLAVLARTILLILTREEERSSLEIITTALEHQPQGTFHPSQSETEIAKSRFQILEDEDDEKMRLIALH